MNHRIGIEARPALVECRSRIGDGEGDTRIGHHHPRVLVSPVERRSGHHLLVVWPHLSATLFWEATVTFLYPFRGRVYTLTLDHGTEAAKHERITQSLAIPSTGPIPTVPGNGARMKISMDRYASTSPSVGT